MIQAYRDTHNGASPTPAVIKDILTGTATDLDAPAGRPDLDVALHTADASADNVFNYYLVNPSGTVVATATTPQTVNGQAVGDAELSTANPTGGLWQIDVVLKLTVSGNEFSQIVYGDVTDGRGG